ncbi:hypothetical protein [Psychrobacter aquimaris]|uniref:hypothetical protein n=1 Tax=Psychrobacter aquimaris TaxID=292733 RepID=UPI0018DF07F8|nr:hypothetical protein [Psychrobacter aquimaris]
MNYRDSLLRSLSDEQSPVATRDKWRDCLKVCGEIILRMIVAGMAQAVGFWLLHA